MIELPPFLTARSIADTLAMVHAIQADDSETLVCSGRELRMADPLGLCLLTIALKQCRAYGQQVELVDLSPQTESYLGRMDVFRQAGIEHNERSYRHDRRGTLSEVCIAHPGDNCDAIATNLAQAVVGLMPGMTNNVDESDGMQPSAGERASHTLSYVLSEVFNNALTHGQRAGSAGAHAFSAAQYYPARDLAVIAVVDNGCGLLGSLRNHVRLQRPTHEAAILAALEPRVSCNPDVVLRPETTSNQGLGLTIIRELVRECRGNFYLASGDKALVSRHIFTQMLDVPSWQGTALVAEFPRSLLDSISVNQAVGRFYDTRRDGESLDIDFS